MRKLASVQTIESLEPIPGADAILRAKVLGWSVVVKKGEFAAGDRVVYCEIDSLLPERPAFEFLRASSFRPAVDEGDGLGGFRRPAGFRIRTVKLRGQVSQGICFPLAVLPPDAPREPGADVTEWLGVAKYEVPLPAAMNGLVRGPFPGFLAKTDETRVQLLEEVLRRHAGRTFVVTEKLDGTSLTAYLRDGAFGLCSRNLELEPDDPAGLHARVARAVGLEGRMRAFAAGQGMGGLAVQGEVIGPGVQGNKYGLKAPELRVFSLTDLATGRWLDHPRHLAALESMGLAGVPPLGELTLAHGVPELVALADGPSALNPAAPREGLVFRPPSEEHDDTLGGRLSFKVINPRFLLKYDE